MRAFVSQILILMYVVLCIATFACSNALYSSRAIDGDLLKSHRTLTKAEQLHIFQKRLHKNLPTAGIFAPFQRLGDGFKGLWENGRENMQLRKKIKNQEPITIAEHWLMEESKTDLSKLGTLIVMQVLMPEVTPYLLFSGGFTPSTFTREDFKRRVIMEQPSRIAIGMFKSLSWLEQRAQKEKRKVWMKTRDNKDDTDSSSNDKNAVDNDIYSYLHLLSESKSPGEAIEKLSQLTATDRRQHWLKDVEKQAQKAQKKAEKDGSSDGSSVALTRAEVAAVKDDGTCGYFLVQTEKEASVVELKKVPGIFARVCVESQCPYEKRPLFCTPGFLLKNTFRAHLKGLAESDRVLFNQPVSHPHPSYSSSSRSYGLDRASKWELVRACSERCIHVSDPNLVSEEELRAKLMGWWETVTTPVSLPSSQFGDKFSAARVGYGHSEGSNKDGKARENTGWVFSVPRARAAALAFEISKTLMHAEGETKSNVGGKIKLKEGADRPQMIFSKTIVNNIF